MSEDGSKSMCSWIDERGAKEGALVEIIDGTHKEFYRVERVYPPPFSSEALKNKEHYNRRFWNKEWKRESTP